MRALTLFLLGAAASAGCANDLCGDATGACIALTVAGTGEIDTLQITTSGAIAETRVAPNLATVSLLPVYVSVQFGTSFRGGPLHLDVGAYRHGKSLGGGTVDLDLQRSDHKSATVTIAPKGSPGADMATTPMPDLAIACTPNDLGTLASDPHNCGSCGHDCLGGACANGQCQPSFIAVSSSTLGVAVDSADVYFSTGPGGLSRVSLAGGPAVPIATGNVQAIALAGTTLIVDDTNSYLSTVTVPAGGTLNRVMPTSVLALAVDGSNVYYARNDYTIQSLPLPLTAGTPTMVTSSPGLVGGLASDGTTLFLTSAGQIYTVTLPSGTATLVTGTVANARAIVIDAAHAYVSTPTSIFKLSRSGATLGPPSPIATPTNPVLALAADDKALYFTDGSAVLRLAK